MEVLNEYDEIIELICECKRRFLVRLDETKRCRCQLVWFYDGDSKEVYKVASPSKVQSVNV